MAVLQGPPGATGPRGLQGLVGPRGGKGDQGPPGRDGRDGGRGVQGPPGRQGNPGNPGLRGPAGLPGRDGSIANIEHSLDPEAVGPFPIAGTSLQAAAADHVHKGVHSIRSNAESQLFGDVTLSDGAGISLTQVGNTITITSSGVVSPTGPAGGDLTGTYPNPTVIAFREGGATHLGYGAIPDGSFLKRVGSNVVGVSFYTSSNGLGPTALGTPGVATTSMRSDATHAAYRSDLPLATAYFIDPVNGSDAATNPGTSSATALRSLSELRRRWWLAEITSNTTVTIMGDLLSTDTGSWNFRITPGVFVKFDGTLGPTTGFGGAAIDNTLHTGTVTSFVAGSDVPAAQDIQFGDTAIPVSFTASGLLADGVLFKTVSATPQYFYALKDLGTKTIRTSCPINADGTLSLSMSQTITLGTTYSAYALWNFPRQDWGLPSPGTSNAGVPNRGSGQLQLWRLRETGSSNGQGFGFCPRRHVVWIDKPSPIQSVPVSTAQACMFNVVSSQMTLTAQTPVMVHISAGSTWRGASGSTLVIFGPLGFGGSCVSQGVGLDIVDSHTAVQIEGTYAVHDTTSFAISLRFGARLQINGFNPVPNGVSGKGNTGKLLIVDSAATSNDSTFVVGGNVTMPPFSAASTSDPTPIQIGSNTYTVAQLPTALNTRLDGTVSFPSRVFETGANTLLDWASVPANGYVKRSGTTLVGVNPIPGGDVGLTATQVGFGSVSNTLTGSNKFVLDTAFVGTPILGLASTNAFNTADPGGLGQLTIVREVAGLSHLTMRAAQASVSGALVSSQKARGTSAAPTAAAAGDLPMQWSQAPYDGVNYLSTLTMVSQVTATPSAGVVPQQFAIQVNDDAAVIAPSEAQYAFKVDTRKNVYAGGAALSASGAAGFLYQPGAAGAFTGTPTNAFGSTLAQNRVPTGVDTANSRLYAYIAGAWRYAEFNNGLASSTTLAATQVGFGSPSNALAGDSTFTWNNTSKTLLVGTGVSSGTTEAARFERDSAGVLDVALKNDNVTAPNALARFQVAAGGANAPFLHMGVSSSSNTSVGFQAANSAWVFRNTLSAVDAELQFGNLRTGAGNDIVFYTQSGGAVIPLKLTNAGNVRVPSLNLGGHVSATAATGELTVSATIPYADITGAPAAITALNTDVVATGPGAVAATIQPGVVTYAKIQNISAASRILGRGSAGGAGSTQELTLGSGLALTGTVLSATGAGGTVTDVDASLPLASTHGTTPVITLNFDGTSLTLSAGTTLQRAALTGDVTAPAGSNSTTIANDAVTTAKILNDAVTTAKILNDAVTTAKILNDAVTNAKLANMTAPAFKARISAGPGDPEDVTGTQATTMLDTFTSLLKGLAPASGGGATNFLRADGSWAAPTGSGLVGDADYGDVTVSGAGTVWTIDGDVVTNAKLANMATARFKARVTAGTGDPEDLTGTQATTLLDPFTSTLKGLTPASGGGATNFLRADGSWAAPSGSGAPASATYITQTPDAGLSAEQALSLLGSGMLSSVTATGVVSSTAFTVNRIPFGSGTDGKITDSANLQLNGQTFGLGSVQEVQVFNASASATALTGFRTGTDAAFTASFTHVMTGTSWTPGGGLVGNQGLLELNASTNPLTISNYGGGAVSIATGSSRTERLSVATGGGVTVSSLGSGIVKSTAGLLSNATANVDFVATSRTISTTSPLTGGGDLSANRTLGITTSSGFRMLAGDSGGTNFSVSDEIRLDGDQIDVSKDGAIAWRNVTGNSMVGAVNYDQVRGFWSSNTWILKSEKGGTGTIRNMLIDADTASINVRGVNAYLSAGTNDLVQVRTEGGSGIEQMSFSSSFTRASSASMVADAFRFITSGINITGVTHVTTATGVNFVAIPQPTYDGQLSSKTIDRGASLYIANSPNAQNGITLTNPYALWVDAGETRLDGRVTAGADLNINGASPFTNTYLVGNAVNDVQRDKAYFFVGGGTNQDSPDNSLFRIAPVNTQLTGASYVGTGILATARIGSLTYSPFSGSPSITEATTLYVDNAPTLSGVAGASYALHVANGTTRLGGDAMVAGAGKALGFFGTSTDNIQTVTGSRGGNAALLSLLQALENYGLIINSTTP